jgi:hypothetical protein
LQKKFPKKKSCKGTFNAESTFAEIIFAKKSKRMAMLSFSKCRKKLGKCFIPRATPREGQGGRMKKEEEEEEEKDLQKYL